MTDALQPPAPVGAAADPPAPPPVADQLPPVSPPPAAAPAPVAGKKASPALTAATSSAPTPPRILKPWDKQEGETVKAHAAFLVYLEAGPQRSQRIVCNKLRKSGTLISRWSARYHWIERAELFEAEQSRMRLEEEIRGARRLAKNWAERSEAAADQEIKLGVALLKKAETMLEWPLSRQRVARDGTTTIIEPADWKLADVREFFQLARTLIGRGDKSAKLLSLNDRLTMLAEMASNPFLSEPERRDDHRHLQPDLGRPGAGAPGDQRAGRRAGGGHRRPAGAAADAGGARGGAAGGAGGEAWRRPRRRTRRANPQMVDKVLRRRPQSSQLQPQPRHEIFYTRISAILSLSLAISCLVLMILALLFMPILDGLWWLLIAALLFAGVFGGALRPRPGRGARYRKSQRETLIRAAWAGHGPAARAGVEWPDPPTRIQPLPDWQEAEPTGPLVVKRPPGLKDDEISGRPTRTEGRRPMNPADSGRDSTGRPRSVEDVEEIARLRAENRNVGIAFLASLATQQGDVASWTR